MLDHLKILAQELGADLAGWAGLDRGELALYSLMSPQQAGQYHSALVLAKAHNSAAVQDIQHLPTPAYEADYHRLNSALFEICLALEAHLRKSRIACLVVPPSQTLDAGSQRGLVSHRALAERAGLGIRGRNNLLVTVSHRAHIRLACVLTELQVPRVPKIVWPFPCVSCDQCRQACPADALGEHPEDFRLDLCLTHLEKYRHEQQSPQICGICLAVCPGVVATRD